ncbi:g13030 [Coccomyxa viridis]|uniref:G13030 protein n=1 Tax=Coccomyxa viridis TaxID=1274662 RepID=A0ABP1GEF2_9CHLO
MVYAPLTRCRALGTVPCKAAQTYYRQRTVKSGLLLTEATCINPQAHGYPNTPGLYTEAQLAAWKPIVNAVHKAGGIFFAQLWHVGRASHSVYQPDNTPPVGPSAIAIPASQPCMLPDTSMTAYPVPRELTKEEIQGIVKDYADAAHNAVEAGFDGVEIHSANGYLIEQFLRQTSNHRSDEYGGSIPNRCRFCLEVAEAVTAKVGAAKVGIRLSPYNTFLQDGLDEDGVELMMYLVKELAKLKLLYLHCIEPRSSTGHVDVEPPPDQTLLPFRKAWPGAFLAAGGFTKPLGDEAIKDGAVDLVVFGRWWLANPDLPERFVEGAALNKYDRKTFYSPDPVKGYTDYPFLDQIKPGTPTRTHYSGTKIYA